MIPNLKKKSFPLVCRARQEVSIDVKHQRIMIIAKSSYSFEDRGTDRQSESISDCTLTCLPMLKISWRRGKQYTFPVTLGESHK